MEVEQQLVVRVERELAVAAGSSAPSAVFAELEPGALLVAVAVQVAPLVAAESRLMEALVRGWVLTA